MCNILEFLFAHIFHHHIPLRFFDTVCNAVLIFCYTGVQTINLTSVEQSTRLVHQFLAVSGVNNDTLLAINKPISSDLKYFEVFVF